MMKIKIKTPTIKYKLKTQKVYPELVDLSVTPSTSAQTFNHSGHYGYDTVSVGAIPDQYIVPTGSINITENGTTNVKQYENAVVNIPTIVTQKDIDFVDYDGTILYSYTLQEIQNMSALPSLPVHENLTCQEWNFTLAEVKTMPKGSQVGANYITDDGRTRLYVEIETAVIKTVGLCFQQTKNYGVEVNWGDGSAIETFTGTYSRINPTHTYSSTGRYIITLNPVNNSELVLGADNSSYPILGAKNGNGRILQSILKKVELGKSLRMTGSYCFSDCFNMETITVPNYINPITTRMFDGCSSLKYIVIPRSVTYINDYAFYACYALEKITFPYTTTSTRGFSFSECKNLKSVKFNKDTFTSFGGSAVFQSDSCLQDVELPNTLTTINNSLFYYCKRLTKIKVPKTVTSIEGSAFYYCTSLQEVDFSEHESIPTMGSSVFGATDSKIRIIVPDALYNSWIGTSGWATYASYIVKASEV